MTEPILVTGSTSTSEHAAVVTGRARLAVRGGLAFFALTGGLVGFWALLFPRTFYEDFPVPGHGWVAMLPSYNSHLVTDVGELNLAVAFSFTVATLTLHRLLVRTVLVGYLFYSAPHMVFHVRHLAGLPLSDMTAQVILLSISVILPLALLILIRRPRPWGTDDGRVRSSPSTVTTS